MTFHGITHNPAKKIVQDLASLASDLQENRHFSVQESCTKRARLARILQVFLQI